MSQKVIGVRFEYFSSHLIILMKLNRAPTCSKKIIYRIYLVEYFREKQFLEISFWEVKGPVE